MLFVLGAAVGSAATWKYIKKKYDQIAQEEINSVKEVFCKREEEAQGNETAHVRIRAEQAKDKPSVAKYAAKVREHCYTNYSNTRIPDNSNITEKKEEEGFMTEAKPYTISPKEFGEMHDYDEISLTYYADQVLADEDDELVDDIEESVGFWSLSTFGEYDDDAVFVRNDRLKCDYEILFDPRKYSDVINRKPHKVDN
jgi:hypothetical protein